MKIEKTLTWTLALAILASLIDQDIWIIICRIQEKTFCQQNFFLDYGNRLCFYNPGFDRCFDCVFVFMEIILVWIIFRLARACSPFGCRFIGGYVRAGFVVAVVISIIGTVLDCRNCLALIFASGMTIDLAFCSCYQSWRLNILSTLGFSVSVALITGVVFGGLNGIFIGGTFFFVLGAFLGLARILLPAKRLIVGISICPEFLEMV